MAEPELVAGRREVPAPIAAAVVGQDPLDRDAVGGVEAPGPPQEARRSSPGTRRAAPPHRPGGCGRRSRRGPGPSRCCRARCLPVARDAVTAARPDPAEHLGVEMDELTRPGPLVADDRAAAARAGRAARDLRAGAGHTRSSAARPSSQARTCGPTRAPVGGHTAARRAMAGWARGLAVDGARAVDESGVALPPLPSRPLRAGLAADPGGSGSGRDRPARADPIGEQSSAVRRQPGIRMRHEGPFFDCGFRHQQPRIGALSPSTT